MNQLNLDADYLHLLSVNQRHCASLSVTQM